MYIGVLKWKIKLKKAQIQDYVVRFVDESSYTPSLIDFELIHDRPLATRPLRDLYKKRKGGVGAYRIYRPLLGIVVTGRKKSID